MLLVMVLMFTFILIKLFNGTHVTTGKITVNVENTSCTETLVEQWEGISKYDYKQSCFLDVSLLRLNKANLQTCQNTNARVFIDFFPITSKAEQERVERDCTHLEIPEKNDEFKKVPNETDNLRIVRRLYGKNIIRFRTCDSKISNCSDISKNNNIRCTAVQQYKPISCLEAMAQQWDGITFHNSSENTLTLDISKLSPATMKLCQLQTDPVNLEMFAISPRQESIMDYYTCKSYPNSRVVPFGQKMNLNGTGLTMIRFVSGRFVFRLSRGDTQACTFPKRSYGSERGGDIVALWESERCMKTPEVTPVATTKMLNNACSFTISSFPLFNCHLMDQTLTATIKLKKAMKPHKNCNSELWQQKTVKIARINKTPVLEDVTFNLPPNATFCLEVFLNYPLCPSLNIDDADKCSRPVHGPLHVINCQKQWGPRNDTY